MVSCKNVNQDNFIPEYNYDVHNNIYIIFVYSLLFFHKNE